MDGVVRLLQLTTDHIARIFLKEMKKLSQPQVNNLLALELISWKKINLHFYQVIISHLLISFILVDGRWSEQFPTCQRNNGSCGEYTVSQLQHCNNPTPSTEGRDCSCDVFESAYLMNDESIIDLARCDGLTTTITKECNPTCNKSK